MGSRRTMTVPMLQEAESQCGSASLNRRSAVQGSATILTSVRHCAMFALNCPVCDAISDA